ncbi:MAG TPA: 3-hydroxyacyl-CoA dehydrogenase NAD-binding domain-containing protein [Steroidobacteraceae bacterium]|jgi:3-hydroxyacyl-CoA dehydrogenase|nr:3-hydroxyacyl-CoA dehydrogenase NAD-binding domain-containing protein [Steroidobacteraceae bacterium]
MTAIRYKVEKGIAWLAMSNPPLNALSHALRGGIVAALDRALADVKVRAVVLIGNERAFSSGADIKEFAGGAFYAAPSLPAVVDIVEASSKPVIAAIRGACMGGGLELALGCHYRVALADAKIAFPEVKLGLIPGAGGTQRFPRLVGLEAAVNMIVSGANVPASMFNGTALFDVIAKDSLENAARDFAAALIKEGKPIRRVRDLPCKHPQAEAFLQFAKTSVAAVSRGLTAPTRALEAVGAAVAQKFEAGFSTEQQLFSALMASEESKSLRHAFFAERAASKVAGLGEKTRQRKIASVAVVGAGTMGGGIAMSFANAGIPVTVLEAKQEALDRGIAGIRKQYEGAVAKGRMKPEEAEKRGKLITPSLDYAAAANADLVIEAVFEDLDVKKSVFRALDAVMKRGAILATNTSTLDVNRIAAFTKRPGDVLGMHFFSPANVMKLLEVVRAKKTRPDALATVMALARRIGKTAVVSGVCDGFIGNRMIDKYSQQALLLLEEGASPRQVDAAIEKFGFAMGPFRMSDLAGNDISWHIRKRHYDEHPRLRKMRIADRVCELGRFGQKTGLGWYRYETGRRDAIPDPVIDKIIAEERKALKIEPRKIADAEIVDRLLYALVNEGAHILEQGIAARASDIDVVYLAGYGFPVQRGGPMFYASRVGLPLVARRMKEFATNKHAEPVFWKPARLITQLAAAGKTFEDAPVKGKRRG